MADEEIKHPELEITPAMVEAGLKEFLAFDGRFDRESGTVCDIFRAMWAAKVDAEAGMERAAQKFGFREDIANRLKQEIASEAAERALKGQRWGIFG